jgi:triacylglycerol lipase
MGHGIGRVVVLATLIAVLGGAGPARADQSPAGSNDFSCKPTAAHPRPVVLVHGLGATQAANWSYHAPRLKAAGYCVFSLTYGVDPRMVLFGFPGGTIPMEQSSGELAAFVDRVLAATGAAKVDLVGHSEGTVMPRWYLEKRGGAAKVQKFIALTPLWRGTKLLAVDQLRDAIPALSNVVIGLVASLCGSCPQFISGSPYLNTLNADGEAVPEIEHTNIMSRYDELVVPYTSGAMRDGGTNIVLQDVCPNDYSEHGLVAVDPVVTQLFLNALDPAHATAVRC